MMTNSKMQVILASFLVCHVAGGCQSGKANGEKYEPAPTPALPVLRIDTTTARTIRDYAAQLEGKENVDVRSQVDGYLDKVLVEEGSYVRAGQPLFKINDRTYQAQLEKDIASLRAAQSAEANAVLEVEKIRPLSDNKVVSDIQLKTALTSLQAAKANVEQAKAAVAASRVNLGFTLIKAPVSGYIGRIPRRTGNLISSSDATALTTLSDISKIYAYFSMSENDFIAFSKQLKNLPSVDLILSNGDTYAHQGKIEMIDGQFNKSTAAISIRATFPNPEGLLRSGNTGRVRVNQLVPHIMLVPQAATMEMQDKRFVYKLDSGNVAKRQEILTTGSTGKYFIVTDGLHRGDHILSTGVETITEGTTIQPVIKK
ncbi:efflux RND transporter periplasmic adaptor subunit [Chitinophaga sancti]|uniref:efflux RND transporter periplasmic adaptor subunit n=1 Tax=Chitinophaga sancti TaxID=1004 RepID=UPI003F7AF714